MKLGLGLACSLLQCRGSFTGVYNLLFCPFYSFEGSLVSLVMGLAMGGLAAFGASQTSRNPSNCLAILGKCPKTSSESIHSV